MDPAGDRLDVLTTLVERFDAQHEPIDPPDPIDALPDGRKLSQTKAAKVLVARTS